MVTVNNLNPTLFVWEKRVLENYAFLNIFQKVLSNLQNQVQSNSFDVSKGLESIATIEYIKRINFGSPDRPRSIRNRGPL